MVFHLVRSKSIPLLIVKLQSIECSFILVGLLHSHTQCFTYPLVLHIQTHSVKASAPKGVPRTSRFKDITERIRVFSLNQENRHNTELFLSFSWSMHTKHSDAPACENNQSKVSLYLVQPIKTQDRNTPFAPAMNTSNGFSVMEVQ